MATRAGRGGRRERASGSGRGLKERLGGGESGSGGARLRGVRVRHFFYAWFVLLIFGLFAYLTWFAQVPQPPNVKLNPADTQSKVTAFQRSLQAAYNKTQATGRIEYASVSLTDADATWLLSQKEQGAVLDLWVVHFRQDGKAEVWGTSTRLDKLLHHDYRVVLTYGLDSFDNRASALVSGIDMAGIVLPPSVVARAGASTSAPTVEFPPGTKVSVSAREGGMLLEVAVLPGAG